MGYFPKSEYLYFYPLYPGNGYPTNGKIVLYNVCGIRVYIAIYKATFQVEKGFSP